MLKGINVEERHELIYEKDNSDPKTIFILKPSTGFELTAYSAGDQKALSQMVIQSVVEIKNFDGKDSITDRAEIGKALSSLSAGIIGDLMKKINQINGITGEDKKN